jgi:hypothetical protein
MSNAALKWLRDIVWRYFNGKPLLYEEEPPVDLDALDISTPEISDALSESFRDRPASVVMTLARLNSTFNRMLNVPGADNFWKARLRHDFPGLWLVLTYDGQLKEHILRTLPPRGNRWRQAYFKIFRLGSTLAKHARGNNSIIQVPTSALMNQFKESHANRFVLDTAHVHWSHPRHGAIKMYDWDAGTAYWIEKPAKVVGVMNTPNYVVGYTWSSAVHVYDIDKKQWIVPRFPEMLRSLDSGTGHNPFRELHRKPHGHLIQLIRPANTYVDINAYAAALTESQTQAEVYARCVRTGVEPAVSDFVRSRAFGGFPMPDLVVFHRMSDNLSFKIPDQKTMLQGVFVSDRPAYCIEPLVGGGLKLHELPSRKSHPSLRAYPEKYPNVPRFIDVCGDIVLWELQPGAVEWDPDTRELIPDKFKPGVFMLSSRRDAVILEFGTEIFQLALASLDIPWFGAQEGNLMIHTLSLDHLLAQVAIDEKRMVAFKLNIAELLGEPLIASTARTECVVCSSVAPTACADCVLPYCSERCQELDWDVHAVHCHQ